MPVAPTVEAMSTPVPMRRPSASGVARAEREAISDLLMQVGPDAPTLCEGWTTRDLAAHLVVRESRMDAALGISWRPLAAHAESVRLRVAQRPWPSLIATLRAGPPVLSPMRPIDGVVNLMEFLVHHEDVRRGGQSWATRDLGPDTEAFLWRRIAMAARFLYRRSPVALTLRAPGTGLPDITVPKGPKDSKEPKEPKETAANAGHVTLTAGPVEILLHANGRTACIVDVDGDADAVAALASADLRA
jgi:uncharacterized protein (TIGR03085 family)